MPSSSERRKYLTDKQREHRRKNPRVDTQFEPAEHRLIKQKAKALNMPVRQYVRQAALAYSESRYLVHSKESIHDLSTTLRQIENHLGLISRVALRDGIQAIDIERVYELIDFLQERVTDELSHPPDLITAITTLIKEDPKAATKLQTLLQTNEAS